MSRAVGIAFLGGVSVWTAHLLVSYFLADFACRGDTWTLLIARHAATLVAVVAVIAVTLAMRPYLAGQSSLVRDAGVSPASAQAVGPPMLERPFLARVVLFLNVMFLFAIVLAGLMNFFLAPCA